MTFQANNPGNIRFDPNNLWRGLDNPTADEHGFARFTAMHYGVRALAKTLLTYQDIHGLKTVREIIGRWAPPADHNDTEAYAADVAARCRVSPDDQIDLHDPSVLGALAAAISHHETGQFIDAGTINGATASALA